MLDILEDIRTPISCLDHLELKLRRVPINEFKAFCDPSNRGWQIALRLLSSPMLRRFSIKVHWSSFLESELSDDCACPPMPVMLGMKEAFVTALKTCLPVQVDDRRNVQRAFSAEYYYTNRYEDEVDDDDDE